MEHGLRGLAVSVHLAAVHRWVRGLCSAASSHPVNVLVSLGGLGEFA